MNIMTNAIACPLSVGNLPSAGTLPAEGTKNALPVIAVNNENHCPNHGSRRSDSESMESAKQGSYSLGPDIFPKALKEIYQGANCRTVAERYSIKDALSLIHLHTVSLKAGAKGSAGAALRECGNWKTIALEHGINDGVLLGVMQAYSAGIYGKPAIPKTPSAEKVIKNDGINDGKRVKELSHDENRHKDKPANNQTN